MNYKEFIEKCQRYILYDVLEDETKQKIESIIKSDYDKKKKESLLKETYKKGQGVVYYKDKNKYLKTFIYYTNGISYSIINEYGLEQRFYVSYYNAIRVLEGIING